MRRRKGVHRVSHEQHLEVDEQSGVMGRNVMHLHHVWSVHQLLQLSHCQPIHLAKLLLGQLGRLLGFLRGERERVTCRKEENTTEYVYRPPAFPPPLSSLSSLTSSSDSSSSCSLCLL